MLCHLPRHCLIFSLYSYLLAQRHECIPSIGNNSWIPSLELALADISYREVIDWVS